MITIERWWMMASRKVAIIAGIAGGLGWIVMIIVMAIQGGRENSIPEDIGFYVGAVGVAVASMATGVYFTRARSLLWQVIAAIGAAVAVILIIGLGQLLFTALLSEAWLQESAIFGVVGVVALVWAVAAVLRGRAPGS
ncbi:MAG: hypothetical protein IBX61_09200 [Thermoleophilia bacterium]|nr:hypothetical protein [Thermoleophilia bacterium]